MGKDEGMGDHTTHPAPQQLTKEELKKRILPIFSRLLPRDFAEDYCDEVVEIIHAGSSQPAPEQSAEEELESLLVKEYGFNLSDPVFKKMLADLVLYMDSCTARKVLEAEKTLILSVPYTLKQLGNATWRAEWNPTVKSVEYPERVAETSRTSPFNAVARLREALTLLGVIAKEPK